MKRITALLLVGMMAIMATACSTEESNSTVDSTVTESSQAESSEALAEDSQADTAKVMTYDEYMAAELDSEVVIETYVQAKQSWWEDKATLYTQDQDGAYFIYDVACTEEDYAKLVPGTKIRVTGFKAEWSGEVEIMDGTFEIIEGGDEFIAPITDVTALLGTDELIKHQNQYVSFKGMTVEPAKEGSEEAFLYNYDGSGEEGSDLYFNVSLDGKTYSFLVESYLCGPDSEVYSAVKNLKVGDVIDMEGYLYWYEGVNPHITSIKAAN